MAEPKQKRPAKPLNTAAGQRVLANKKGLTLRRFGKAGIPLAMGAGPRWEDGTKKTLTGPENAAKGAKVRTPVGTTTYKAKAKLPRPPAKKDGPLDALARGVQERIDTITGKRRTPISAAMKVTKTGPATWKAGK